MSDSHGPVTLPTALHQPPCTQSRSQAMTTRLETDPSLPHLGWQQRPWRERMTVWSQGTADTGGTEGYHHGRPMVHISLSFHHFTRCHDTSDAEETWTLEENVQAKEQSRRKWCRKCCFPYRINTQDAYLGCACAKLRVRAVSLAL